MRAADSTVYVIGVDVGTQGARGVAVAAGGTVVARASALLPAEAQLTGSNGAFEQDAEAWWRVTCAMLRQLARQLATAGIAPDAVTGLCVSATSGTFVPLDASYRPLRRALMYSDGRAADEVLRCNSVLADLTTRLGYRFNASFALPKLLWLQKHEPEIWAHTALIAHQADYIVGQLTGIWGETDHTNVLKTGYDLLAERYPPELASELGLPPERLPRVVPSGTPIGPLTSPIAASLGLSPRVMVVAGMTDGCTAQFAAGATKPGEWVSSLGTTLTIKGVSAELLKDPQGRIYCHRHPESGWLPGGASNTGGEILARRFPDADLAAYDARAAGLAPTALLAYPLVRRGERFPFVAPHAEGFLTGEIGQAEVPLDLCYTAFLEGVALLERLAYEVVNDLGAPVVGPIRAVGGAARSRLWLRIRASVCNRPFVVPAVADPAMGAAVLVAASQLHPGLRSAAQAMIRTADEVIPDSSWVPAYQEHYTRFKDELRARGYLSSLESKTEGDEQ